MKNLKQLVLPCYKLEMAMSVEAWYFLHGSTDGICNLTYLLSLLSKITVSEVQNTKRGLGYVREVVDDSRAAHRESDIPPDNQGIRRGTCIPFQRATIRDFASQFGKEEERKTDRRNVRGNG